MAWFILVRLLFLSGVAIAAGTFQPVSGASFAVNVACGAGLALLGVLVEWRLRAVSVTHLLGALIGGSIGLGFANVLGAGLFWFGTTDSRIEFLHSFVYLAMTYLGLVIGGRHGEWLEPTRLITLFRAAGPQRRYKVLDTSVIIDGRIADVCETGFLDGTLVIPQFVLKELQQIADSSDTMRRNRGRRGLDILQ